MEQRNNRREPVGGTRHAWFLAFEREFRQRFGAAAPSRGPAWTLQVSEVEWRVWMHASGGQERTVSIDLPPNYAMFQPAAVAGNLALRLRGAVDDAADTSGAAAQPRS